MECGNESCLDNRRFSDNVKNGHLTHIPHLRHWYENRLKPPTSVVPAQSLPPRRRGREPIPGHCSIQLEIIAIGADSYIKNPITGAWDATPASATPFGNLLDFGAFVTDFAPAVIEGFTLVGEVQLDGERVYHLRGPVTGQALADLLDNPQAADDEGEVEDWIGVEDFLIRKTAVQAEAAVEAEDSGGMSTSKTQVVMTLSDYGKPVDIQPPTRRSACSTSLHQPGRQSPGS